MTERDAGSPGARLRTVLESGRGVLAPGCYDATTAGLADAAGFEVCYVSGASVAAVQLGVPDLGFAGPAEILATVRQVRSGTARPIVADADAGFGDGVHAAQTVRRYEQAGVAGLHIEDQVNPKRCGHMAGVRLVSLSVAAERIRAAAQTREDLVVIARTDALQIEGLSAACERAAVYVAAGADALFIEGLRTTKDIAVVHREFPQTPLVISISEAGGQPTLHARAAIDAGAALVIFPIAGLLAALAAYRDLLGALRADGSADTVPRMPWGDLTTTLGLPAMSAFDDRISAAEDSASDRAGN